jgi:hypothetical protein
MSNSMPPSVPREKRVLMDARIAVVREVHHRHYPPYHRANFVNLVEKKWPGEIKLNCSGILEEFTDIYEQS